MLEQMTPNQIIDHVVEYYKTNSRSINDNGDCVYNGPDGAMCGFAILCENPKELPEDDIAYNLVHYGEVKLKPEFSGQSADFYCDIQSLHDCENYWIKTPEGNELTESGIIRVNKLKETYK